MQEQTKASPQMFYIIIASTAITNRQTSGLVTTTYSHLPTSHSMCGAVVTHLYGAFTRTKQLHVYATFQYFKFGQFDLQSVLAT